MERETPREMSGGLEQFTAERVELMILIILMAFMISIIDETFRMVMYAIVLIALIILGYNFYMGWKSPQEPGKKEEEVLISVKE